MKDRDLISKEEIKTFFQRKIKPKLAKLEEDRKTVVHNLKVLFASVMIGGFILAKILIAKTNDFEVVFTTVAPSVVIMTLFFMRNIISGYRQRFKSEVIRDLFSALIKDCSYRPESKIDVGHFRESRILNKDFSHLVGEDWVSGKIGNCNLEFSEVQAIQIKKNSKGKIEHKVIFQGLFYIFTLPVDLKQNTLILNDQAEDLLGRNLGRFVQKSTKRPGYELVQLESVEFEKRFVVYSDNQIKSRVLLNPLVLENLTSFKKKFRHPIELSIRGDKIYIAIETKKDYFEPRIFGEVVNLHEIREIYDLVQLVRDLQEDLDLDSLAA